MQIIIVLLSFVINIPSLAAITSISVKAPPTARTPYLAEIGENLFLTWIEPIPNKTSDDGSTPSQIRMSIFQKNFTRPYTIAKVDKLFVNWADYGKFYSLNDGRAYYAWLEKSGSGTYAYDIIISMTTDNGRTWNKIGKLNQDNVAAEHGFFSFAREGSGVRAYWLDGRETVRGGATTLRTAIITEKIGKDEVLDMRVCDCCATSAVNTSVSPIVFYRGRASDEVRDIFFVRKNGADWYKPVNLSKDKWKVAGCPVNGPSASSLGDFVVVSWFTRYYGKFQVRAAVSVDGGLTFSKPIIVDGEGGEPLGRVGTSLIDKNEALVSWLSPKDEAGNAPLMIRRISKTGKLGEPLKVTVINSNRNSGFPILRVFNKNIYLTFTEPDIGVKVLSLPVTDVPKVL